MVDTCKVETIFLLWYFGGPRMWSSKVQEICRIHKTFGQTQIPRTKTVNRHLESKNGIVITGTLHHLRSLTKSYLL